MTARSLALLGGIVSLFTFVACSSSDGADANADGNAKASCSTNADCTDRADTPICDAASQACVALPAGHEIGYRDGSASSVDFVEMLATDAKTKPVDLAFHPDRPGEVWVIGYGDNSVWLGLGVDSIEPTWTKHIDPAAQHFMHKPTAIAMGAANTWATCGNNDNSQNTRYPDYFMGPALFSADLDVFAKRTPTGLGSHIDMLHSSPFCRGMAHIEANWYWAFNAYDSSLDKYNFAIDHGPGNDDHSDGEIYRYAKGQVKGVDDVPSHLVYDPSDQFLYVADTGNQRIVRLDTTVGTKGGGLPRRNEPLVGQAQMVGTSVEDVVAPGVLKQPSGLELHGDLIYVTDAETSTFHVFDKSGTETRRLATDLPTGSLAGFTFDANGKIWFTDRIGGRVFRIDPK